MPTPVPRRLAVAMLPALLAALLAGPARAAGDAVVLSFAFVGCNRLDKAGENGTGAASTANEAQLRRTFKDVKATQPLPQLLFLAGDIVKAKKAGTQDLAKQLAAWSKLVDKHRPKSVQLVAFTGNHELLKDSPTDKDVEIPNQPAYAYWQQQMKPYIAGSNGPAAKTADGLMNDETSLSYSFKSGSTLFIVVNTDSQIDLSTTGNVPLIWLGEQLSTAQADPSVQHIFVMGHKPIAVPGEVPDSGGNNIRAQQGGDFYKLLNTPGPGGAPSKVRAYLAAHSHQWAYTDSLPATQGPSSVPQIIAGNGGSPAETGWPGSGNYFGYTLVQVMASGKVTAQSYGRTIPAPYWQQTPAPPKATARGKLIVLKP